MKTAITVLALLFASGHASAALVERLGGKAIYDPVANLTWLQDANYAKTSGYDADGLMTWNDAVTWAASLNIDGVTGWRLPGGPMDIGFNRTASEMGNLFYNVLGGVAGTRITVTHNSNIDLIQNVQSGAYWSGVELDASLAWHFNFFNGGQEDYSKNAGMFGWAVRSGDVGDVAPVPVPAAAYLFASALAGIGMARRRLTGSSTHRKPAASLFKFSSKAGQLGFSQPGNVAVSSRSREEL